jgi:hypothetical protein
MIAKFSFVATFMLLALLVIFSVPEPAQADPGFITAKIKVYAPQLLDAGVTTCVGGYVLDPDIPGACSPGTKRVQIRGMKLLWTYTAADVESGRPELFIGTQTVINNANHDANGAGPEWGTFIWESEAGEWEGTFSTTALGRNLGTWSAVAHGSGELAGLQMKGEGMFDAYPGTFMARVQGDRKK